MRILIILSLPGWIQTALAYIMSVRVLILFSQVQWAVAACRAVRKVMLMYSNRSISGRSLFMIVGWKMKINPAINRVVRIWAKYNRLRRVIHTSKESSSFQQQLHRRERTHHTQQGRGGAIYIQYHRTFSGTETSVSRASPNHSPSISSGDCC